MTLPGFETEDSIYRRKFPMDQDESRSTENAGNGRLDLGSIRVKTKPKILRRWSLFITGTTWSVFHYYMAYCLFLGIKNGSNRLGWLISPRIQAMFVAIHSGFLISAIYYSLYFDHCIKFHLKNMDKFPKIYEDHAQQALLVHEDLVNYRLYLQLFGAIFLAPFRMLFGGLMMISSVFMIVAPQKLCGNNFQDIVNVNSARMLRFLARTGLWFLGICEAKTVYVGEEPSKPTTVISNHIGLLDVMYATLKGPCSFVCKKSLEKAPCIGSLIRTLQCITVDRDCQDNRRSTYSAIVERITRIHKGLEQKSLVVYPEGTATKGNVLLPFRSGAFGALLPLQPVIIVLDYSYLNITFDAYPWKWWIVQALCSPVPASLIAYWLPVIQPPSKEEIESRGLRDAVQHYAEKAHETMKEALTKLNPKVGKGPMPDYTAVPPSFKSKALARLYGPVLQRHYRVPNEYIKSTETMEK